jgi:hypothetical protein
LADCAFQFENAFGNWEADAHDEQPQGLAAEGLVLARAITSGGLCVPTACGD